MRVGAAWVLQQRASASASARASASASARARTSASARISGGTGGEGAHGDSGVGSRSHTGWRGTSSAGETRRIVSTTITTTTPATVGRGGGAYSGITHTPLSPYVRGLCQRVVGRCTIACTFSS